MALAISEENRIFIGKMAKLTPPIVMQDVLGGLVNIVTSIMIARSMGLHEITAVGISNQIFLAYSIAMVGIVAGCGVFIGQYYGKGEKEQIYKVIGIGFTLVMVGTTLVTTFTIFFPELVMGIFTNSPEVIALGAEFIQVQSISYFFFGVIFLRNNAMRTMGKPKLPMMTTSTALLISLGLNYVLIFVVEAPLAIIGLSAVVARIIEICLQEFIIRKYDIPIRADFALVKKYFSFDMAYVKRYFGVSIFILMNMIVRSMAVTGYTISYGFTSPDQQGAIQISTSMLQIFQIMGGSISVATGIVISQTLGAGNRELAIRYSRKCIAFGLVVSSTLSALLLLLAPVIISFYQVEPNVERYILNILIVTGLGMIVRTTNFINLAGIMRNGGDVKFSFMVVLIAVVVFGMPLSLLAAAVWNLPIYWVVALVYTEEVFKCILSTRRVLTNKWANQLV